MSAAVSVGTKGVDDRLDAETLDHYRQTFDRSHALRLPAFLGPDLVSAFEARIGSARFVDRVERGTLIERRLDDDWLMSLVTVIMNDLALFAIVDRLTGCGQIGCFSGRVYERQGPGQYYPWHSDCSDDRLVGLTANLSHERYTGGVLQLRRAGSREILGEVRHEVRGDAALFRIDPSLEHHVTPVTSAAPRLVLAGWFRRRPKFADTLRHARDP
jgi:hypothetical protein